MKVTEITLIASVVIQISILLVIAIKFCKFFNKNKKLNELLIIEVEEKIKRLKIENEYWNKSIGTLEEKND